MLQVSDEVALRVLAVRTDAVTGLPLDVYQEPPTARFRPPGEMLHIPGFPWPTQAYVLLWNVPAMLWTTGLSNITSGRRTVLDSLCASFGADIEDAETKWLDGQPLMAAWMAGSAVSLLSSLFWLPLGFIGGVLGIAGASLMVCRCHHCISFALAVKASGTLLQDPCLMASFHPHHYGGASEGVLLRCRARKCWRASAWCCRHPWLQSCSMSSWPSAAAARRTAPTIAIS